LGNKDPLGLSFPFLEREKEELPSIFSTRPKSNREREVVSSSAKGSKTGYFPPPPERLPKELATLLSRSETLATLPSFKEWNR